MLGSIHVYVSVSCNTLWVFVCSSSTRICLDSFYTESSVDTFAICCNTHTHTDRQGWLTKPSKMQVDKQVLGFWFTEQNGSHQAKRKQLRRRPGFISEMLHLGTFLCCKLSFPFVFEPNETKWLYTHTEGIQQAQRIFYEPFATLLLCTTPEEKAIIIILSKSRLRWKGEVKWGMSLIFFHDSI